MLPYEAIGDSVTLKCLKEDPIEAIGNSKINIRRPQDTIKILWGEVVSDGEGTLVAGLGLVPHKCKVGDKVTYAEVSTLYNFRWEKEDYVQLPYNAIFGIFKGVTDANKA